jgi:hypothetical protein
MPKIEDEILARFFQELEKDGRLFQGEDRESARAVQGRTEAESTDFVKVLSEAPKEQLP